MRLVPLSLLSSLPPTRTRRPFTFTFGGGSGWGVSQIFLGYGMLVGIVGAGVGAVAGCLIVWNSNELENWLGIKLWDPDVYAIERIPDVVDYSQAAVIVLVAILASVAGAAIPARKAAQLEVVEALRVE